MPSQGRLPANNGVKRSSGELQRSKSMRRSPWSCSVTGAVPVMESEGKLPALAVSGPFGAIKEQSNGLYAQTMVERGYLTIAFDPSYTGESGGYPRRVSSPDINTEDFSAAVDYLSCRDDVDLERIGIIGICGWGGISVNAAAADTRIKATLAVTSYIMTEVATKGYFGSEDSAEKRMEARRALSAQRTEDYRRGTYLRDGGNPEEAPVGAPQFVKVTCVKFSDTGS